MTKTAKDRWRKLAVLVVTLNSVALVGDAGEGVACLEAPNQIPDELLPLDGILDGIDDLEDLKDVAIR